MINKDGELIYIENYKMVKSYLDNAPSLAKYRTRKDNGYYAINGLIVKQIGTLWAISFLNSDNHKYNTYMLSNKENITRFKMMFSQALNEKVALPYFLQFSNSVDDNLLISLTVRNYLLNILKEVDGLKEEA